MNMKIIKSGEKKRILSEVNENFGIEELPSILIETGKQKVRGFTGNITREEIAEFTSLANVEIIGLYLFKKERGIRLSLDATQVFANQISKGFVEINEEQFDDWIRGKDLNIKKEKGIFIIKHAEDYVGCAISNGERLINYVPKERRVRQS